MSPGEAAPQSTLPYPPLHRDKKFVVLSDWDGTITTRDSNDYMTDNLGYGKEKDVRETLISYLERLPLGGDAFKEMLDSVAEKHSLEECKEVLRNNIHLDPGFKDFHKFCKENDIPIVLVSSGMEPTLRAVLSKLIGDDAETIDVVSNNARTLPNGKWEIQYRHPTSAYGHDKSQAILPYRDLPNPPTLFFFGDGVSDMSAARHADVLFVKLKTDGENDLHEYCNREGIPHILFSDFSHALNVVKEIVSGERTKEDVLKEGTTLAV